MPLLACAKCREAPAQEGDLWCLGCSAWKAPERELSGDWDLAGARALANALRSLGQPLNVGEPDLVKTMLRNLLFPHPAKATSASWTSTWTRQEGRL